MINLSERMLEILSSRNVNTKQEIEEFLNPSISLLSNANELKDMTKATERINIAIAHKETILIYGDYDADGVCASAILYKFFKSKGIEPLVFIPNRFEDGYGLSAQTVDYIAENMFPDLVITVDCGITSVEEVEQFNDLGIDVIITDHHLPQDNLPNAIAVIDVKQKDETYAFHDFCGAGVALKLVQALGANPFSYIDIAAIATIGDIVPLLSENRVIASLGISKINSASCNLGIKMLKEIATKSQNLSSEDIAFKIVPRINAAGRMDSAMLAFNLLVEDTSEQAKELALKLEDVNTIRIQEINNSMNEISKDLKTQNTNNCNCIVVSSKSFHEGVIGIVATKLVEDFGVPCFVFKETEDGLLKGSCRSTNQIDIHEKLSAMAELFVTFGGHSQAAGLSIEKQKFDEFKKRIASALPNKINMPSEPKYDYEISEREITINFAKEMDLLEPTGCGNEKPIFKLKLNNCTYKKTSNPKHYQLITASNTYIPVFNGKSNENLIMSNNAYAYINVSTEIFNNQYRVKPKLINISCENVTKLSENEKLALVCDLEDSQNEIVLLDSQEECLKIAKTLVSESGTVVVARTEEEMKLAQNSLKLNCFYTLPKNQESCILYAPKDFTSMQNIQKYNNVVMLSGSLTNKTNINLNVISFKTNVSGIRTEKQVFADCYRVFASQKIPEVNDIYEYVEVVLKYLPYSKEQIAFCLLVFAELNIVKTKSVTNNFLISIPKNQSKSDLSTSSIYKLIKSMTD